MVLSFRIGKVPVVILPAFFLTAALLGALGGESPARLVAWMVIVLLSVLAHELGHAAAGLAFGLSPSIELHGMGGTTSWTPSPRRLPTWSRVAITLAGPAAGFALAALVFVAHASLGAGVSLGPLGAYALATVAWVNISWGVLNLLPILPLDGGNVLLLVLQAATHGAGERPARIVSMIGAGIGAILGVATGQIGSALLALWLASNNWRALAATGAPR